MKVIYLLIAVINNFALSEDNSNIDGICDEGPKWKEDKIFTRIMDSKVYGYYMESAVIPCCAPNKHNITWHYHHENSTKILINNKDRNNSFTINKEDPRYLEITINFDWNKNIELFTCEFYYENEIVYHTTQFNAVTSPFIQLYTQNSSQDYNACVIYVGEENVQKYCKIFQSKKQTAKSLNHTFWFSADMEGNIEGPLNRPGITIKKYISRDGYIAESLLEIEKVTDDLIGLVFRCKLDNDKKNTNNFSSDDDYNSCVVEKKDDPFWILVLYYFAPPFAIFIIICIILAYFQLEIRLFIKDKFYTLEVTEYYEWDVYICYGEESREFIKKYVLPCLESRGYKCYVWEISEKIGGYLPSRFQQNLEVSRRFLLILSESLINDNLLLQVCELAVNQALLSKLRIITLIPPNYKEIKHNQKEIAVIKLILNTCKQIQISNYENKRKYGKFYCQLLLTMPPMRHAVQVQQNNVQNIELNNV